MAWLRCKNLAPRPRSWSITGQGFVVCLRRSIPWHDVSAVPQATAGLHYSAGSKAIHRGCLLECFRWFSSRATPQGLNGKSEYCSGKQATNAERKFVPLGLERNEDVVHRIHRCLHANNLPGAIF